MVLDRKRSRAAEVISFSKKDQGDIIGPHDDPIALNLKIETHRVKRILIDTRSLADILYLSVFKKMNLKHGILQKVVAPLKHGIPYDPKAWCSLRSPSALRQKL